MTQKRDPGSPCRSKVPDQVLAYDKLGLRLVGVNDTFIKDLFITKLFEAVLVNRKLPLLLVGQA